MRLVILVCLILSLSSALAQSDQTPAVQRHEISLASMAVCVAGVIGLPALVVAYNLKICTQEEIGAW
jgi:hypothetical protein